ncbi:MAG TPA: N-acetylglucosamine-6-phosphate deacetylase [Cryptosporangiaceae bacterium]|nr:N-acetylglucosamine-6-phosphate deacetylase [Cryptosporangiaceae bacterium]
MTLLHSARLVLPIGVLDNGWLATSGGRIAAFGGPDAARPAGHDEFDLSGRWLLPGFVDLHVHGGGGGSFGAASAEQARAAVALHRTRGTTTLLASLMTAPLAEMAQAADVLADLADEGAVAGIHAEGPFLAAARCGAQDPASMLAPDPEALGQLVQAARGHLRVVTVAPELPGALTLIRRIVEDGMVAAVGHTDATFSEAVAGLEAGARLATHLFNGMRGLHHRDPGPVVALMEHPDVVVELIADGAHLDPAVTRMVFRHCGAGRVALVSDATAAAGMADGSYPLGSRTVQVRAGVARLAGTDIVAGSTVTLDAVLRRTVAAGVPVHDAVTALSATPAQLLGIGNRVGALLPGLAANLVVLGPGLDVHGVMTAGTWHREPL